MKKIQLYVDPDKEDKVYNLIEDIEKAGTEGYKEVTASDGSTMKKRIVKRGYTQDRLKEILKVYSILAKQVGSDDPYEVLNHVLTAGADTKPAEKKEEPKSSLKKFVDQGKNGFM
jgi:hypothetical protein